MTYYIIQILYAECQMMNPLEVFFILFPFIRIPLADNNQTEFNYDVILLHDKYYMSKGKSED